MCVIRFDDFDSIVVFFAWGCVCVCVSVHIEREHSNRVCDYNDSDSYSFVFVCAHSYAEYGRFGFRASNNKAGRAAR